MPKLVSLYIRQTLIGFALSAGFVALLLWTNVANLAHLVTSSPMGYLALFMLFMFNGIVFSGVQFGISIMRMGEDSDGSGGKSQRLVAEPVVEPALIPVRSDRG
ncbi:hypothetical protein [Actibacterium ureilyticum]|uniref:hypothetical protein n=1 Tax=Actibacterium ureilyticum TaxID=1590614 RepID=UPI000BAAC857|nr:hypothetical protein [Actibacterium ureilyticum]